MGIWTRHQLQLPAMYLKSSFGLLTACYVFTKLMRPLICYWHGSGMQVVVYLDDGMVAAKGEEEAEGISQRIQDDLVNADLIVNVSIACLSVPASKTIVFSGQLEWAVGQACMSVKIMPSIVGKTISVSLALGLTAQFKTRALHANINTQHSLCQIIPVSPEELAELKFWLVNIERVSGQNIWYSPAMVSWYILMTAILATIGETGIIWHKEC